VLLLVITTILWAFSFSLIGEYLAGHVDSGFSALVRIGLAALVFLPFLRWRNIKLKVILLYMLVGAFQLGIMYLFSFRAYLYLTVPEFLLFTVLTPLYITLIYDLLSGRRLRWGYVFSALLAVLGAAIIRYHQLSEHFWWGLLLVQAANISFAIGMVGYKRLMEVHPLPQHTAFSWFYLGAAVVAVVAWFLWGNPQQLPTTNLQWLLHVELWRDAGRCRHARHHEQHACAGRAAGQSGHLAAAAALAELYHRRGGDRRFTVGASTLGGAEAARLNGGRQFIRRPPTLWRRSRQGVRRRARTADDRRRAGGPSG
jgi:carboxylate/amino acid/amine transporter